MIREVVKIDEELCDGCGLCVPGCYEGALQIIDGKARLISDLLCDGLGACIGHCPQGAITTKKRDAEPYDESRVMEMMVSKGKNTVTAHLKHLKERHETGYLKEGIAYLRMHGSMAGFDVEEVMAGVHGMQPPHAVQHGAGCPGSQTMVLTPRESGTENIITPIQTELRQWPVQMHLVNPTAPYFRNADVLIAADCTAYALGGFHADYLKGKGLAIACPKLDSNMDIYVEKIRSMIDDAKVNTLTVMIMQVPCCMGLLQMVRTASSEAARKVPVKLVVVGIEGDILKEEWV